MLAVEPRPMPVRAGRHRLAQDLRAGLTEQGFTVHYQPRLRLADGAPCGAEALLRWPNRRRGPVARPAFIPTAEQTRLSAGIGGWVLRAACADALGWPEEAIVSVNVSACQLQEGVLIPQVAAALERSGLQPERLELELTESTLIDFDEDAWLVLAALRDRGVGIALDHFGTGHASLGLLKRLPLTAMKLDRALVRGLPRDPEDAEIVRAIVATGHAIGLIVVGDGIETEGQRGFLAGVGTAQGQGTLFGRPVPEPGVRQRLASDPSHRGIEPR